MNRLKLVLGIGLALIVLVLVLQNTETVDTRLLFVTVSMPRAALLFVTFLCGMVVGMLTSAVLAARRKT